MDENGRDIGGVVGPLREGQDFSVICEVRGGNIYKEIGLTSRPQPTLNWYFGTEKMVKNVELIKHDDNIIISKLTLVNAQKDWNNKTVKCTSVIPQILGGYIRAARVEMLSRPKAPLNCRPMRVPLIENPYVAIHCKANHDGGLQQFFVLQIPQRKEHGVLVNKTIEELGYYANAPPPLWFWLNVTWDIFVEIQPYEDLVVTAQNELGSSDPVIIPRKQLLYRKPAVIETTTEEPPVEAPVWPIAVAIGAVLLLLAVAAALAVFFYKRREGRAATVATSKRPSQNVVQVDSEGRNYVIAYPPGHDKEAKPDFTPKPDHPPRVVLESAGGDEVSVRVIGIPALDAAVAAVWNRRGDVEQSPHNDCSDDTVPTSVVIHGHRGVPV